MIIEYPNRIFDFNVFITNESEGEPQEFEENRKLTNYYKKKKYYLI